jgi:hypothetical protein
MCKGEKKVLINPGNLKKRNFCLEKKTFWLEKFTWSRKEINADFLKSKVTIIIIHIAVNKWQKEN